MPNWFLDFTFEAEEDLQRLDSSVKERVIDKIEWLGENFDVIKPLPLGYEWQGFFKLRVGDWRVVYDIDYSEKKITIHRIDRRDKIYKRRKR